MPTTIIYPPKVVRNVERWYDRWGSGEDVWYQSVNQGSDSKSDSISSDGHAPTAYSRVVVETLANEPSSVFIGRSDLGINNWGRTKEIHITSDLSPLQWGYPGDWGARMGNLEDKVSTNARNGLSGANTVSLGTSIAEARKTAEMLADRGGQMGKALDHFKKYASRLRGRPRRVAEAFAGAWLEGYYGWRSLANDAFDLDRRLRQQVQEAMLIRTSSSSSISQKFDWGYKENVHYKHDWNGRVKVGATAKVVSEFAHNMNGWGLDNPIAIAWELQPLSFVLDWFIPVGNTLTSLTATAGLSFEHGYVSRVTTLNAKHIRSPHWDDEILLNPGDYSFRVKEFYRSYLAGFPPARLYANENPFSTPRVLSGLALVTQALVGR